MRKLLLVPAIAAALSASPAHAGADWTTFNLTPYSIIGQVQRLQMMLLTNIIYARSGISPTAFAEAESDSNKMNGALNGWADFSAAHIDNDFSVTKYDGEVKSFTIGAEQSYSDKLLVGIAGSFANTNLDTSFNNGNHEGKEVTIAPYARYKISDGLQAGFIAGYAHGSMDMDRYDTFVSRTVTGDLDYDRVFASANLSKNIDCGKWNITGTSGFTLAYDRLDGYTDSEGTNVGEDSSSMGQANLGARAAYKMGRFTPYLSATYTNDVLKEATNVGSTQAKPSDDRNALTFSGGINLIETSGWSGGVSASTEIFAGDTETHSFSLGLKLKF